jgi:hypothetical protein
MIRIRRRNLMAVFGLLALAQYETAHATAAGPAWIKDNKAIERRLNDSLRQGPYGALEVIFQLYADKVDVWHCYPARTDAIVDREALIAGGRRAAAQITKDLPDVHDTLHRVIVTDQAIILSQRLEGTLPNGKPTHFADTAIYLRDPAGQIIRYEIWHDEQMDRSWRKIAEPPTPDGAAR